MDLERDLEAEELTSVEQREILYFIDAYALQNACAVQKTHSKQEQFSVLRVLNKEGEQITITEVGLVRSYLAYKSMKEDKWYLLKSLLKDRRMSNEDIHSTTTTPCW